MSNLMIRASEPEDIPALTEVFNQPRVLWGTMQLPFTSVAQRSRKYENRPDTHLVAVIDGKVIGTLGLVLQQGRRAHAATLGMAVHDAYAGRGAGTALMAAAASWLEKSGSNSSAAPQQSQIRKAARCSPPSMRQGT